MAGPSVTSPMDRSDIQAVVFSSYKALACSSFVLARVRSGKASAARACLGHLLDRVTFRAADADPSTEALNVAITYEGFAALGLPQAILDGFPREYAQGMDQEDRARALGDVDASAPGQWAWGSGDNRVHVMFMVFGKGAPEIEAARAALLRDIEEAFDVCYEKRGKQLGDDREHFGFRDGLSQPNFVSGKPVDPNDVPWGEVVLGEPNLYGKSLPEPLVPRGLDPTGVLGGAFGRNGSYLVARELLQDVHAFWSFLDEETRKTHGGQCDEAARDQLAAKMLGRTKDGVPLADCDPPSNLNAFDFQNDKQGHKCPIGAHIRRANPRAALDPSPEESVETVRARRIVRRGRSYGAPNWTPLTTPDKEPVDRGLVFICLNANIRRQFEFVQQTWMNNTKFAGLYDERDPIVGTTPVAFTIPQKPVRRHVVGIPAFTRVRGGAYFFMPSRRALRYLNDLP